MSYARLEFTGAQVCAQVCVGVLRMKPVVIVRMFMNRRTMAKIAALATLAAPIHANYVLIQAMVQQADPP